MINQNNLQKAIGQFEALDEEEVVDMLAEFSRQQPHIFEIMTEFSQEIGKGLAFKALIEMTLVIWQSFLEAFESIPLIREEEILGKEQESLDQMDGFDDLEEKDAEMFSAEFMEKQNQPVIFNYVTLELIEMYEEAEAAKKDTQELEYLLPLLKMIIDLFDDEINRPRMWIV